MHKAKIIISMIMALILTLIPVYVDAIAASGVQIAVNDSPVNLPQSVAFVDENSRTQVTIEAIAEMLRAEYVLSEYGANLRRENTNIVITAGDKALIINGDVLTMDTVPVQKSGMLYAPIRFIAEGLGYMVEWDQENHRVNIFDGGYRVIGYFRSSSGFDSRPSYTVKILSVEELVNYHRENTVFFDGRFDGEGNRVTHPMETEIFLNTDMYNKEFFDNYFLVFVVQRVSSISTSVELRSVDLNESSITIEIGFFTPTRGGVAVTAVDHIVLKMDNSQLDKEIALRHIRDPLPRTEDIFSN